MNDTELESVLNSIARREWNGPGFNPGVERAIAERKQAMGKKNRTFLIALITGASLLTAGVATAVTIHFTSYRATVEIDGLPPMQGEFILNDDNSGATFIADDGTTYVFEGPGTEVTDDQREPSGE